MLPEITFFGLQISTYKLAMALGFIAMLVLMLKRRRCFHLGPWQASCFTALLMLSGLLGCKLLYILENMAEVSENGLTFGGFSFFGAVFLIPLLMVLFGKAFHLSARQSLDASAPCVVAMIAVIRFGCFLNGCCGGIQAELFGYRFRWPTQALESIGDFVILLWLLGLEENGETNGGLYPRFLFAYGILRFVIEFLRDTPKDWFYLSHGQWFSLIAVGIALLCRIHDKFAEKTT